MNVIDNPGATTDPKEWAVASDQRLMDMEILPELTKGLVTPEQVLRHYEHLAVLDGDHKRAKAVADRLAADHYRTVLGPEFFQRLHNTWPHI